MKKIKVLHILHSISFGGVERRRLSLAKFLNKDIFEQKIICNSHRGGLTEEILANDVDVIEIGNLKSPLDWKQHKKVQKIIEDYKPDIIHGAVFEGVTMTAINGWLKNVPIIIIEETSDPQNRSWKGNLLMKIFSTVANKVIGVSEGVTEEYLKDQLHLSSSKAITINNGVALPREVSAKELIEAKNHWGISEYDFVIGSTGRMLYDSHKRFSDLITAFTTFFKGKENIKLLLVGDGPEKVGYEMLAKELNITNQVIFTGYQSDVTLFYSMMDVFALVSAREAFGLVLAEAMLNKLPIIATKVGGIKYIVEDAETGFLVEPMNVKEITQKLETLYQDSKLRSTMGEKGYEKAIREYSEEVYVKKIEQLYLDLV